MSKGMPEMKWGIVGECPGSVREVYPEMNKDVPHEGQGAMTLNFRNATVVLFSRIPDDAVVLPS